MRRFWFLVIAIGTLACILAAGCAKKTGGSASNAPAKLHFAVLGKSVHPYWAEVQVGTEAAAKEFGVDVEFFVPPKEDSNAQVSRLETYVGEGVNGIAFAASDPSSVKRVIDDAAAKQIPTVALDTDAPQTKRLAYIGTDNYGAGRIAGETLGKLLKGKGKVAISTGSLSATNSRERMQGFGDVLKKDYPGIKTVTLPADKEDSAVAQSNAEAALIANPDLTAFYGVYAINGPACAKAVESAGKVGKVKVVCFDTTPDHMKFINSGGIDATIGQRPYMMGYKSIEFLNDINRQGIDKTMIQMKFDVDHKLDTGVDVVTKANLEEYRAKLKKLGIPVEGW